MSNQNLNFEEIFPGQEFSGQFTRTNLQAFIQSRSPDDGKVDVTVDINIEGVSLAIKDWIMDPDQPVPPSLTYQSNDWSFAPPSWLAGMKVANLPQSY